MSALSQKIEVAGIAETKARLAAVSAAAAGELAPTLERAAMAHVQTHLDANYIPRRNALGGTPTGYWKKVRGSLAAEHGEQNVILTLSGVGLAMKYHGGVIKPSGRPSAVTGQPIRFLTIPVDASAHGKRASDFGDRLYIRRFAGGAGRQEGDSAAGMGLWLRTGEHSSDSDPLLFWLVRSVTIKPDPAILPPAATTATACAEAGALLLSAHETA